MFANARLTALPGFFLRASRNIMLTRSQLSALKSNLVVQQDKVEKVFYTQIGKHQAVIEYEEDQEGKVLKLMHTNVPKELEGQGIGTQLAKETFEQIVKNGQKAELHCDFLKNFIETKGAKYREHIVR